MTSEVERLLAEQACYYCERAGEYEDWWFRRGRYDHGPEANARWFAEAAEVQAVLDRFKPAREVLELACGTGLWTRRLVSGRQRDRGRWLPGDARTMPRPGGQPGRGVHRGGPVYLGTRQDL